MLVGTLSRTGRFGCRRSVRWASAILRQLTVSEPLHPVGVPVDARAIGDGRGDRFVTRSDEPVSGALALLHGDSVSGGRKPTLADGSHACRYAYSQGPESTGETNCRLRRRSRRRSSPGRSAQGVRRAARTTASSRRSSRRRSSVAYADLLAVERQTGDQAGQAAAARLLRPHCPCETGSVC